jgi:hypothetical protein
LKQKKNSFSLLFGLILLCLLPSCLDEDFSALSNQQDLEPIVAIPFIESSTTLLDLIPVDDYIQIDEDELIHIIYQRDSFASVESDSLLDVENQFSTVRSMELGAIELEPYEDDFRMTILQLSQNIEDTALGNYFPQGVEYSNENGSAWFPPINPQSAGYYSRPGPDAFQYILIESGIIEISLYNEMPVEITSIDMTLMNMLDSAVIGYFSFDNIAILETAYCELLVENQLLFNDLLMHVHSFHLEGSGEDPFDTDTYVELSYAQGVDVVVSTREVLVKEGLVRFPEEEGPSDTISVDLDFENGMLLSKMDVIEGDFNCSFESSVKTDIDLSFTIPQLKNSQGEIFEFALIVTNTENSGAQNSSYSIDGYNFDLSDSENKLDVYFSSTVVPTLETEDHVLFSENDTVRVSVALDNMVFSSIEGYFGQVEKHIDESELNLEINALQAIGQGIILSSPTISFISDNTMGIPFEIELQMQGFNNGQTVDLAGPKISVVSNEISTTTFTNDNSQIVDFIALNPIQMTYSGTVISNPLGNTGELNFIGPGTGLMIGFEMDLPLQLSIQNLVLTDTLEIKNNPFNLLQDSSITAIDYMENTSLVFRVENGFPFDASLDIYLFDSITSLPLDSIRVEFIESAIINNQGKVSETSISNFSIDLEDEQINNFIDANKIAIKTKLDSYGNENNFVKLYTDYKFIVGIGIINQFK